MFTNDRIWMGKNDEKRTELLLNKANRHGLITGASGTGKTWTLRTMAEGFAAAGVPVFLADIKGDLSCLCKMGEDNENIRGRVEKFGIDNWEYTAFTSVFWDVYGESGLQVRATISDMGPLLLSRLMNLSEVQQEVMNVIFKIADDNGLLLVDTKDLKAMLSYVADHSNDFKNEYGNLSPQSIASIQRNVVSLETQGADVFFSEPMLDINDLLRIDDKGRGVVNILHSVRLAQNKTLYATFMLWLMSEIYENLPEIGDPEKPKAVLFIDEAHLLFNDAPKVLIEKVEQVVRLVRSKGVGIYFCSQSPADIPDNVLGQLGNKVQHALRAYTPKDQKAIRAAAESYRPNPKFSTETAITELGTGEALVSFLDEGGAPSVVERCFILPPQSKTGTLDAPDRKAVIECCPLYNKYSQLVDNESAYEVLSGKKEEEIAEAAAAKEAAEAEKIAAKEAAAAEKQAAKEAAAAEKAAAKEAEKKAKTVQKIAGNTTAAAGRAVARSVTKSMFGKSSGIAGSVAQTMLGSIGKEMGSSITRGLFGTKK